MMINIELAYKTKKIKLSVAPNSSIAIALQDNSLYQKYLQEVSEPHLGIFGKVVTPEHILKEGERIELYLPLIEDPMQKRKNKIASSLSLKASS